MKHIGEKIKELRRKNNMTQEKLAERLNVSYQTVSKWETGITSPDLSLIVPLARLFKITTDELFSYNENADSLRKKELDDEYEETWRSGDLRQRLRVSEQAVKEFPDDMEWLDRLAWAQGMSSFEYKDDAEYIRQQEEAIAKFASVIENAADEKVKASSIQGIVSYLSFRGRNEEAEEYAKMYPENYSVSKDDVLLSCLTGERRIVHYQKMLDDALLDLLNLLHGSDWRDKAKRDAAEQILNTMMPDGNYLYYHVFLSEINLRRAKIGMEASDHGTAEEMLKLAFYHAKEYDDFASGKTKGVSKPFFDHLEYDVNGICKTGTTTELEDITESVKKPLFDPLREKIDKLIKDFT